MTKFYEMYDVQKTPVEYKTGKNSVDLYEILGLPQLLLLPARDGTQLRAVGVKLREILGGVSAQLRTLVKF